MIWSSEQRLDKIWMISKKTKVFVKILVGLPQEIRGKQNYVFWSLGSFINKKRTLLVAQVLGDWPQNESNLCEVWRTECISTQVWTKPSKQVWKHLHIYKNAVYILYILYDICAHPFPFTIPLLFSTFLSFLPNQNAFS